MASGNRPHFGVFVSRKGADDKNFYTRVGSAWEVSNGGISIKLEPNIAISGECVLFPPKDDE